MNKQDVLIEAEETNSIRINNRCFLRSEDAVRVVFISGVPIFHFDRDDRLTEKFVIVSLLDDGLAKQVELAKSFGHDVASIRRWQMKYRKYGIDGLGRKLRESPLLKMGGAMDNAVRKMFNDGERNVSIAHRLGVSETTIRNTLKRLGLERPEAKQQELPNNQDDSAEEILNSNETDAGSRGNKESEADPEAPSDDLPKQYISAESTPERGIETEVEKVCTDEPHEDNAQRPVMFSLDDDPSDRKCDRALACQGILQDAAPLFAPGKRIQGAGVLLAVPLIVSSGVVEIFERLYRSLGPAFYGLRTVVMTLMFMALIRIKRPENLKEQCPADLGRALGLDRAPEVKTIRRKLGIMARLGKGAELMRQLARRRLKGRKRLLGFLYVDGHVREYHGKGKLAKAYVTRRRLAAPATTDIWVNDALGDPVFLVTSEVNESLTKMLEPVLDEVEAIVGKGRRFTVIFDRGGWSPKLFARLIERGIDILTYRKGKIDMLPLDGFQKVTARVEGRKVTYKLHEMTVQMGKTKVHTAQDEEIDLCMRQVTRLRSDEKHQTQVLTTRQDLSAVAVLWRMFNRWRQENFFKYMRQEYAIDGLVDYSIEAVSPDVDRLNPERKAIEEKLRKALSDLKKLENEYGAAAVDNEESKRPTMRGFKVANGKIGKALRFARKLIEKLKAERDALPKRVPATDLERLPTSCKIITDSLKMTAYQIENDLVRIVWDHYPRAAREGHKLIVAALKSSAHIDIRDGELRVTLAAQSSHHRTRAIAKICEKLNSMNVCFPGTNLRLRYNIFGS